MSLGGVKTYLLNEEGDDNRKCEVLGGIIDNIDEQDLERHQEDFPSVEDDLGEACHRICACVRVFLEVWRMISDLQFVTAILRFSG